MPISKEQREDLVQAYFKHGRSAIIPICRELGSALRRSPITPVIKGYIAGKPGPPIARDGRELGLLGR